MYNVLVDDDDDEAFCLLHIGLAIYIYILNSSN